MKVDVVFCHQCAHCHLKDNDNVSAGGWCCVDAPAHITAVPAKHFCSYGIEKIPCLKAEDLQSPK